MRSWKRRSGICGGRADRLTSITTNERSREGGDMLPRKTWKHATRLEQEMEPVLTRGRERAIDEILAEAKNLRG